MGLPCAHLLPGFPSPARNVVDFFLFCVRAVMQDCPWHLGSDSRLWDCHWDRLGHNVLMRWRLSRRTSRGYNQRAGR
jgi:hypothetical protein